MAHAAILRFAGLPADTLRRLSRPGFSARLDGLLAGAEWVRTEGDELADLLRDRIGTLPAGEHKAAVVGLRRALHTGRQPNPREWNTATAALIGAATAERIERWIDRRASARAAHDELPAALRAERLAQQLQLRQIVADARLGRALIQAGPTLLDEAEKWIADPDRTPKQQKLLRLARYVSRAAAKTSPYSTFMTSGVAGWAAGERPVTRVAAAERIVLELDGEYLTELRAALLARPELAMTALVRVNPSTIDQDDTLRFLGRAPQEPIVATAAGPLVRAVMRRCAGDGPVTRGDLVREIAETAGADHARVAAFVERLIASGLIEAYAPAPDLSADVLAALAEWAEPAGLAAPLRAVRDVLAESIPADDVAAQRRRMSRLDEGLRRLTARFDLTPLAEPVHEVAVLTELAGVCGRDYWAPVLADLDVFRRFLAVFDRKLPLRVAVAAYAAERFGPGARVPLLTLYRAVHEALSGPAGDVSDAVHDLRTRMGSGAPWDAPLGDSRLARLRRLDELRLAALQAVGGEPDDDGVVRVAPVDLEKVVAEWPPWVTVPDSIGCYVQPLPGPARAVLNAVHGGHGRGLGRLARLGVPAAAAGAVGRTPGVALAELGGLLGSTLNAREPGAPYEIDYPFTVSGRPEDQRIAPGSLQAVHHAETGLLALRCAAVDDPIEIVHLGMSSDAALPPLARFLDQVFGRAYLVHPGSPPLVRIERFTPARGAASGVVRHPRIESGHVVLQRARWFTPASAVPVRDAGEDEAYYLLRLAGWRHAQGVPESCFVRMWSNNAGPGRVKDRKPTYLDFADPLLVMDFERHARNADFLLFDEALPDPLTVDGAATEVFFQVSGGGHDG